MTSDKHRLSTNYIDFSDDDIDGYEDDWSAAALEGFMDPEIIKQLKAEIVSEGASPEEADARIENIKTITSQINNDIQNQGD